MGQLDVVLLTCIVHPVDTTAHPTVPAGYRWAVMVGQGAPSDMDRCANAGWCPDVGEAEAEGDRNAATAARVALLLGLSCRYGGVVHLDYDPVPAEGDRINTL